ncbi:MAG: helicase-related protein [Pseudomonadota bacterium]
MTVHPSRTVTAVLGPTNTGKTHLAIERMLGHGDGMIGFPLRLLARENYDRIVKIKGASRVALVTGEEKIVPPRAKYFCCTVESMPLDRPVEFLAVDEIQLCADPERGHMFTDRLLHARGTCETMFLGAETVKTVLKRLVPEAKFLSRPRFSKLTWAGPQSIHRLPPRSAIVAFSAAEVYGTAELIRRRRGGTAVVLGALSPRTRNAQVALFESGDVDYLVATDAIGMGLNLDLDHVCFARVGKFDGRGPRRLTPAELAQIAGRAGRHMSHGTFGTTREIGGLDEDTIEAIESHRFDPERWLYWRNRSLDFNSPERLLRSLEKSPPAPELLRVRDGEDHQALAALVKDSEILELTRNRQAVELLWEVCQIPDYRKILSDEHLRLLSKTYAFLRQHDGRLPEDWVSRQMGRLDVPSGDIDQLSTRIAHIRTWTYITHRGDWLRDPLAWQEKARAIEDRLSDALHEKLTQRFVDRRASLLVRRMRDGQDLVGAVRRSGEVLVEGEYVGRLEGFRFTLDGEADPATSRPLMAAARQALAQEFPRRVAQLEAAPNSSFALAGDILTWNGEALASLRAGPSPFTPQCEVTTSGFLDGALITRVRRRLDAWLADAVKARLAPLFALQTANFGSAGRGLAYQLLEGWGLLPRTQVSSLLSQLDKADRATLKKLGVRIGRLVVFLPSLQKKDRPQLLARLWALYHGQALPFVPDAQTKALYAEETQDRGFYQALGFCVFKHKGRAPVALRSDLVEQLAYQTHKHESVQKQDLSDQAKGFVVTEAFKKKQGLEDAQVAAVLLSLGYRPVNKNRAAGGENADLRLYEKRQRTGSKKRRRVQGKKGSSPSDSPFAVLQVLKTNRPLGKRDRGVAGRSASGSKT